MNPRRSGALLLGIAAALEVAGFATLVWQGQDIDTISAAYTLPALAGMVVGIAVAASGYGRLTRSTDPELGGARVAAGAVVGGLLMTGVIDWQLAKGLLPSGDLDLDVYATVPVFFLGLTLVAGSVGVLGRPGTPSPARGRVARGDERVAVLGGLATVMAVGVALLVVPLAEAAWFSTEASDVDSLYQFVALEFSAGGLWLVLASYRSIQRVAPRRAIVPARRWAEAAGVVLLVAGPLWWWKTPALAYALEEIIVLALVAAGAGLVLLSSRRTAGASEPSPSPARSGGPGGP